MQNEKFRFSSLSPLEKISSLEKMKFATPDSIPDDLVFQLLQDENPKVKDLAVEVLCRTRHPALSPFIVEQLPLLEGPSKRIYINALQSLGAKSTTLVLSDFMADNDSGVREAVAWALISFGEEAVALTAEKFSLLDRESKVKVIRAFSRQMKGGRPIFEKALQDDDFWIRKEAVIALNVKDDQSFTDILIKSLEDTSPIVRLEAVRGLQSKVSEKVLAAVRPLLEDPNEDVASAANSLFELAK